MLIHFNNIQKSYLVTFSAALYFVGPVLVLFYQENSLSYTQIFLLQSWFNFLIFTLEIPSGVLGDLFSRKSVLIFSLTCYFLGLTVYSLSFSFWGFFVGETLWAFSSAFRSGTGEAFVYDSLKELKKESEAKQVYANLESLGLVSFAVSSIVGSAAATVFGFRSALYLTVGSASAAWLFILSYKEPVHEKVEFSLANFVKQSRDSLKISFVNKSLSILMFNSAIIAGILLAVGWYFQPHMKASGIPVSLFGVVYAFICMCSALLVRNAPRLESRLGPSKTLLVVDLGIISAVFCFSLFLNPFLSVLCVLTVGAVRATRSALFNDYLNRFITSDKRATVISLNHFFASLTFTILGPISGYISDHSSFSYSLFGLGVLLLISVILLKVQEGVVE